jgi:hypothetical protein
MSAPYLTAKKRVGYKADGGYRKCSTCSNTCHPVYAGVHHLQCHVIGVINDPDADVAPGAGCKAWKARLT